MEISQVTMPLKSERLSNHGTDAHACQGSLSTGADRAMLTLLRCRHWEETAGLARVPMTADARITDAEVRNERAQSKMRQRLRYSWLAFTQKRGMSCCCLLTRRRRTVVISDKLHL